ncbi:MAG: hypothetical protein E6K43_13395 [Gammaproteobacteria bacterium]|nr:MAG: hypothetical protein E6K43_13395 [Gammaproteobacteria bacterium]
MGGPSPFDRTCALARRRAAAPLFALFVFPGLACASIATSDAGAGAEAAALASTERAATDGVGSGVERSSIRPPSYGPAGETPGIPSDAELEGAGAMIGEILIDNQNIFNLEDPKDDVKLFRLANHLHSRTRKAIVRDQLLFRSGERYSRRLIDESERILRAESYFYDAWIRPVRYHDGQVDLRVTTRDVWTLNPGFNFGRSGGSNSTGVQLEEINLLGTGAGLKVAHTKDVDRTKSQLEVSDMHAFGTWTAVDVNYADLSDGRMRDLRLNRPFYALDTRWAAGVAGMDDVQTDSLYDRGQIIDRFQERRQLVQVYGGWSNGLQNGWVRRWSSGVTYDEHRFEPVSTWTGVTAVPEDRRFLYPWIQFDLVQDDYLKLWNHDQIARTEDFYLGTTASVRLGWADAAFGSSRSALMLHSSAGRGFRDGGSSTLLLAGTLTGRLENGEPRNVLLAGSVRYYVEQNENWLFFTTLQATKGWRLDLEDQILLGGDNGLRGYPLRYQDGTARALWTVEQRFFTDWYPFRLFRVGAAVFFDTGRTWGAAPLAAPSLGPLRDAGFGLRFGNSRSGLGNVVHVDLAFPFNGDSSIKRVQFLVQTEQRF